MDPRTEPTDVTTGKLSARCPPRRVMTDQQ